MLSLDFKCRKHDASILDTRAESACAAPSSLSLSLALSVTQSSGKSGLTSSPPSFPPLLSPYSAHRKALLLHYVWLLSFHTYVLLTFLVTITQQIFLFNVTGLISSIQYRSLPFHRHAAVCINNA